MSGVSGTALSSPTAYGGVLSGMGQDTSEGTPECSRCGAPGRAGTAAVEFCTHCGKGWHPAPVEVDHGRRAGS